MDTFIPPLPRRYGRVNHRFKNIETLHPYLEPRTG